MKKRMLKITIAASLMVVMLACNIGPLSIDLGGGGGSDSPAGEAGTAAGIETGINAPAQGAALSAGPVEIAYYATSVDGVATVELSVNGEILSMVSNPDTSEQVVALKYTWEPEVSGSHTIRVRAMDAKGSWSDYAAVTVNVAAPPQTQPDSQAEQPDQDDTEQDQDQGQDDNAPPESDEMEIYNVKHDKDLFYYGGNSCGAKKITIEADVTHPEDAYAAIIFFRFWDKEGEGLSSWSSGNAMTKESDGHFSITMESDKIPNYNQFEFAILYYQIKVQSKPPNPEILAGTEVIKEIELQICK